MEIFKNHEKDKYDTKGKFHIQSNFPRGYKLMKDLHWIKLTQYQRCKSDLIHTEFIEQLGNEISVTTEMLSRYKFYLEMIWKINRGDMHLF